MSSQSLLFMVIYIEVGAFLLLTLTVTYDLLRRAREHQSGLVSQIETFLGTSTQTASLGHLTHTLREHTIREFDRFGWRGGAKMIAGVGLMSLIVCGMTLGSIALTSAFTG